MVAVIYKLATVVALAPEMESVNIPYRTLLQLLCKLEVVVRNQIERVLGLFSGIEDVSGAHQEVREES